MHSQTTEKQIFLAQEHKAFWHIYGFIYKCKSLIISMYLKNLQSNRLKKKKKKINYIINHKQLSFQHYIFVVVVFENFVQTVNIESIFFAKSAFIAK